MSIKRDIEANRISEAADKITSENAKELILWKDPFDYNRSLLHVIASQHGANDILNTFVQLVQESEAEPWITSKSIDGMTCLHTASAVKNGPFLGKLLAITELQVILNGIFYPCTIT